MAFFIDRNRDGVWSDGDLGLNANGAQYTTGALQYAPLNDYSAVEWSDTLTIAPASATALVLDWHILETAGNEIQGDNVNFDIRFTLEQTR